MLSEAADHADPLRRRSHRDLALQHVHCVRETAHAVPTQLHVEVEAAPNNVKMIVDQARQNAASFEIYDLRFRSGKRHDVLIMSYGDKPAVLDRNRAGCRFGAVQRREHSTMQNEVGCGSLSSHECFSTMSVGVLAAVSVLRLGSMPQMCGAHLA